MLNYGDYKAHILKVIDNRDTISKKELYDAFLDLAERYLTEKVSSLNYERALINEVGEEEGNQLIEQIATSNLALRNLDDTNGAESDPRDRIVNLLSYIECEFRTES